MLQAEGGKHGLQSVGQYAFFALLFQFLYSLCPAHISGVAAGECEGGELQRVGTVRGRFTRWYQLIGGGHGIQQNAGHVQQKIFAKRWYIGPLGYIGAEPEGLVLLSPAKAEVYTPVVDCAVKAAFMLYRLVIVHVRRRGEHAAVGSRSGYGPGVHKYDAGKLAVSRLRAFPVREVAGGVTYGERIVCGHVSRAEAGAAEAGLEQRAGFEKRLLYAGLYQLEVYRHRGRVYRQGEVSVAGAAVFEYGGGFRDVVVHAAGTACNDALIHGQPAVLYFIGKAELCLAAKLFFGADFHLAQYVAGVCHKLAQSYGFRRVEGQRSHGFHGGKVYGYHAVVAGALVGGKPFVFIGPAVYCEILLYRPISLPYGRQACRFGSHHVYSYSVIHGQACHSGACEFQHPVLYKAVFIYFLAEGDGHVVRTYAPLWRTGEPYEDNLRISYIIGIFEQLLYYFGAALAYAHCAYGAVACVAVRAQYHFAAARHHLPGVLVYYRHIGRNEAAAVLYSGGKAKYVVVLVYGAAYGAEAVVAIGHYIGQRELGKAAGLCGLYYANVGYVVGNEAVEFYMELALLLAYAVRSEYLICHGALPARDLVRGNGNPVFYLYCSAVQLYHVNSPFTAWVYKINYPIV